MIRVYWHFILRKTKTPFIQETAFLVACFAILSLQVSFPSFLSNFYLSGHNYQFLHDAFFNTRVTVQIISVLTLGIVLVFARNIGAYTGDILRARMA